MFEILEADKHYALVTVEYPMSEAKYVLEVAYSDPEEDDVRMTLSAFIDDRVNFRILEFKML